MTFKVKIISKLVQIARMTLTVEDQLYLSNVKIIKILQTPNG